MLLHILKIIREQFRSNLWILSELLVVFIVIWVMIDYFNAQYTLYHKPVGFKTEHVYQVTLSLRSADSPSFIRYEKGSEEPQRNFERILERIRRHPDVEAVAFSFYSVPYKNSNSTYAFQKDTSNMVTVRRLAVSEDYFQVFGIRPVNGGSPEELSERVRQEGLVISATLAEEMFGRTNVVGEKLFFPKDSTPHRIIAVTEPVRNDEYNTRLPHSWFYYLDIPGALKMWRNESSERTLRELDVVFRTRDNVPTKDYAEKFKQEMHQQLQAGNYWVSDIKSYDQVRNEFLSAQPEANVAQLMTVVGIFLLSNVFLALIGTFWFRVNRRREEIGLRMAVGSSASGILKITLGEGLVLLTLSAIPALIVCLNLVYIELVPTASSVSPFLHFCGVSVATWCVMALIILLAVYYPARKASKMNPSDALHYE